jgi:hypothetical protein
MDVAMTGDMIDGRRLALAPLKEVVGVFSDASSLEAATEALHARGFDATRITMIASEAAIIAKLGHKYRKIEELEDDPNVPRVAFRSHEDYAAEKTLWVGGLAVLGAAAAAGVIFISGGPLGALLTSGVIGAEVGGFMSGVLADFLDQHHARHLEEQLAHGGLLLFVRIGSVEEEAAAKETLTAHAARDVHAHALPAGAE